MKLARETPLEFAVSICRFAIAELLIAKGAKTNVVTYVDLSMPSVAAVPLFVGKLPNLKVLKLNDAILASVPTSVRKKGDREILHYFQDLAADELIPYRCAKVMVLGKEGVGKASGCCVKQMCFFFDKSFWSDASVAAAAGKGVHQERVDGRHRRDLVSAARRGAELVRLWRTGGVLPDASVLSHAAVPLLGGVQSAGPRLQGEWLSCFSSILTSFLAG